MRSERQRGHSTPSRQRTCCSRSAAADSDTNRRTGNVPGTAAAVRLPSSTFSRSSHRQQSPSQERPRNQPQPSQRTVSFDDNDGSRFEAVYRRTLFRNTTVRCQRHHHTGALTTRALDPPRTHEVPLGQPRFRRYYRSFRRRSRYCDGNRDPALACTSPERVPSLAATCC